MGSCLCKTKKKRGSSGRSQSTRVVYEINECEPNSSTYCFVSEQDAETLGGCQRTFGSQGGDSLFINVTNDIKELIKQTVELIRYLVGDDQEPPKSLLKLNLIAEKEGGWILVVMCLIDSIVDEDPLGPAVIMLFLDESPLPTRESISRLIKRHMCLEVRKSDVSPSWHRNACIVLGSLAEKLAGTDSLLACTKDAINYLIENLNPENDAQVIMYSLIALEKFAQANENRAAINRIFERSHYHPLTELEQWLVETEYKNDWKRRQVGFCARWSLDNIFVCPDRQLSYTQADMHNINSILNHEDVSEYLKIGSNGLEARCDVTWFESVRCTFEAIGGVWFYEVLIMTPGVMQIGFATKQSKFCNHEGYGIGDDEYSIAYDGCRQLIWFNAKCTRHEHERWKAGDYLGCLLDIPGRNVQFYLNGVPLDKPQKTFIEMRANDEEKGFFAAASFMAFQQCSFNFGHQPFVYPPNDIIFKVFNDYGVLTPEQKCILPKRAKMERFSVLNIPEDSCELCCSNIMDTILKPCGHGGICFSCSGHLDQCPICRKEIVNRVLIKKEDSLVSETGKSAEAKFPINGKISRIYSSTNV